MYQSCYASVILLLMTKTSVGSKALDQHFGPVKPEPGSILPVWLTGGLLIFTVMAAGAYTFTSLLQGRQFDWGDLALWSFILALVNAVFLLTAWQYRHRLSTRAQVFILDWAGTSVWYWTLGPLYQFLTITFNTPQLTLNAFAFFWEVPIVGGMSFLLGQIMFRPVHRYLITGHTDDPDKLYRFISGFPIAVVIRTVFFTAVGYAAGAWQLSYFTDFPKIEALKMFGNGIVLSLFLALFYYLAVNQLLGWIRTRLRRQYNLQVVQQQFYKKVFSVVMLVTMGCLLLMVLVGIQSFQSVIKDQLVTTAQAEMRTTIMAVETKTQLESQKERFELGERGQTWVLSPRDDLPATNVLPETKARFESQLNGVVEDRKDDIKIIVFETYGDQKMVSLIYPADFYGALNNIMWLLVIGGVFVAALALVVTTLFNRIMTRATTRLIDAVEQAERTGVYIAPPIHTGDEFETLSDAYKTFIDQTHERTEQLHEERARLQASIESLSLGFIMTDIDNKIIVSNHAVSQILDAPRHGSWDLSDIESRFKGTLALAKICQDIVQNKHHQVKHEVSAGSKILRVLVAPITATEKIIGTVILIQDITEEKVLARSKDEFFSIASHELRTPLTAIRGNTSMIQQYYPEQLKDPSLAEMVNDIHDSSIRLIQIVNDFLDLSRLEQGRMVYQRSAFKIDKVIEDVLYEM
ncbi:MAG: hypothetical protein JWL85_188, partial [Candidatus Saccharibacteria bacterium]|nr:hypothetical protein [Candidatus Saccharibacteria bacterium]